jgi:YfiH family protein
MTVPVIISPALSSLSGIRHAFFTREGGVSSGMYASLNSGLGSEDDRACVSENRRRMASTLGAASTHLVTAHQVHSPDAVVVTTPFEGELPRADALVTAVRGIAVAINVADCGPVLFADAQAGVVGAAHAGWKGAVGGVLEAALDAMEELGARRENITAVLGPCIRQPSYEVGPEFVANVTAVDPANSRFFIPSSNAGYFLFDLGGLIAARLDAAGVGQREDLGLDTYADEQRFFSYRRTTHRNEPDYGRQIAAIVLA